MKLSAAVLGVILLSSSVHALGAGPEGDWLSEDHGTKVRITTCDGNKLCGKVVWLDEPISKDTGKPKTDIHNPDPAKRTRPLLGLTVFAGMQPSGDNKWSGTIYNADDGKNYSAHVDMSNPQVAKVAGCVLGVLCKTQNWTRAN